MSDEQVTELPGLADDLLAQYSASPGAFDEMLEEGGPRPHWRGLMDSLQGMGRHELASRWENGRRIIREHGVTYNVYGDPQGMDRPWALDLVPLVLSAGDWAHLDAALRQRSRLLNRILTDVYCGGQRLLRHGFLPPELIYANPGFLRPCRGIVPASNVFLHLLACDVARSADGKWWVLADRAQAPSGAGYALENRTVISRILPDEIRDAKARRLAGFFGAQRQMLLGMAPPGCENPSVVLLTPGPHNETYFEHAYLARHLGIPLVEGADLTVRGRRVLMKTLEGLQPVDVILRRVDDSFCDPLELRGASMLGIPGLVEATRAGKVTVANALGTGLLNSPAFLPFLPGICRQLLDEDLLMPSVGSWWCGQGEELRYVLEHLEDLVIKPAFGPPARQPWFGGSLTKIELEHLADMIRASPADFVGQERVVLSRTPVWSENRLEDRPFILRTYVAHDGDSFAVLPGGLARIAKTTEDPVVSMQSGGGSKDAWVLSDGTEDRMELLSVPEETRPAERASLGVPSRVADNLYWLGRYTERLEQTLRGLRTFLGRLSGEVASEGSSGLAALSDFARHLGLLTARPSPVVGIRDLHNQVLQLLYKPEVPGGVRELLGRIRFIASAVRDRFSGDTWRILGRLEVDSRVRPGRLPLDSALTLSQHLVLDLAAFSGMEMENMIRGHGWLFLDLGRRVERGLNVVHLIRSAVAVTDCPSIVLEAVLEVADSVMTYRRRHFEGARLPQTMDLLLREDTNPRSLAFQVRVLAEHARDLPGDLGGAIALGGERRMRDLHSALEAVDMEVRAGEDPLVLTEWLLSLAAELEAFSDEVTSRYFSHVAPRIG